MMIRKEQEYRNTLYWLERFEQSITELDNTESLMILTTHHSF